MEKTYLINQYIKSLHPMQKAATNCRFGSSKEETLPPIFCEEVDSHATECTVTKYLRTDIGYWIRKLWIHVNIQQAVQFVRHKTTENDHKIYHHIILVVSP